MTANMLWVLAQRCDFPSVSSAVQIEQLRVCNSAMYHRPGRLPIVKMCEALGE